MRIVTRPCPDHYAVLVVLKELPNYATTPAVCVVQIPRGDDDALLREVSRRTRGYSGAELANLLNEGAILQARLRCVLSLQ